jgi:hypothetical protein
MVTYREKNGSSRDYTPVICICGKTVKMYNLERHQNGKTHPPVPDLDLPRRTQERKEAEERERLFRAAQAQFNEVVTQLNTRLFTDAGESAASSDLVDKGLSLFDNNLSLYGSVHPLWKGWTQDFVMGLSSYYHRGPGMTLYEEHLRSMEQDHMYRRKIERERRRLRVSMRRPRPPAIHVPAKNKRIKLPVKLKAFLGEVDYSA